MRQRIQRRMPGRSSDRRRFSIHECNAEEGDADLRVALLRDCFGVTIEKQLHNSSKPCII